MQPLPQIMMVLGPLVTAVALGAVVSDTRVDELASLRVLFYSVPWLALVAPFLALRRPAWVFPARVFALLTFALAVYAAVHSPGVGALVAVGLSALGPAALGELRPEVGVEAEGAQEERPESEERQAGS